MSEKTEGQLKYCIIGAGGTGGSIAFAMADAGKDVAVIARGRHLEAMRSGGLHLAVSEKDPGRAVSVKAFDMESYDDRPDVIFVCVKGYSLDETVYDFIRRVSHSGTVVIPILNIYGTGGRMQEKLPDLLVTDGCIYVAAEIREPGVILKKGDILRVVYGVRNPDEARPVLDEVRDDLEESGIRGIYSDDIRRDALQKFSYVSPAAACGLCYDVCAGAMQEKGEIRDTFTTLVHEIDLIAYEMGIRFKVDIVQTNLSILDNLNPDSSTSMQRDIWAGKNSEIDGLLFEVVRLADRYGVSVPTYRRIAAMMREKMSEGDKGGADTSGSQSYVTFFTTTRTGEQVEMAVVDEFDYDRGHYVVAALVKNDTILSEGRYIYRCYIKGDDFRTEKIADSSEYERIAQAYLEMSGQE